MAAPDWRWVTDEGLLCRFAGELGAANAHALALSNELGTLSLDEIEDLVVGARSVLIILRPGRDPSSKLFDVLGSERSLSTPNERGVIEIPVSYGAENGPDLSEVARLCSLDERELVSRHATPVYTVAFIGFSPGFPYLLGLPAELRLPRLDTPRPRIPAGSVGIGDRYTGIYPRSTAGGWRIIGRTEIELFDPLRKRPALLAPGDRVRFVA